MNQGTSEIDLRDGALERRISFALLAFAVLFTLIEFVPELFYPDIHHSDGMFHLSVLRALDTAFQNGRNPLDFWYDSSPFGYALFRTYQYLPYLGMYAVYLLSFKLLTLASALQLTTVVLASLIPLSIHWGGRMLGLARLESSLAGVASVLIAERDNFGFGLQNFTFGTTGIITQLWAMVFLAPAIAGCFCYLTQGKRLPTALFGVFLTFGSHVVTSFVVIGFCGTTFLYGVLSRSPGVFRRGVTLGFLSAVVTAHQWVFVLKDAPYINQSNIEPGWKYAGQGVAWVWETLKTGELFDRNRFPALTVLCLVGLCVALFQWSLISTSRETSARAVRWLLPCNFVLMLSLLIGWEVWGGLLRDTPVLRSLHLHRFIVGAHVFGIFLIGIGAAALIRIFSLRASLAVLSTYFILVLLRPAFSERMVAYGNAHTWRREAGAWQESGPQFEEALKFVDTLPRGWVYSGAKQTWQDRILQANYIPPHYFVMARGLNSLGGMLYHAFSLAGDTMFVFSPTRPALYELFGVGSVIAPNDWEGLEILTKQRDFGNLSVWTRAPNRLIVGERSFFLCGDLKDAGGFMQRWTGSDNVERRQFGEILVGGCEAQSQVSSLRNFIAQPPNNQQVSHEPSSGLVGSVTNELPWLPWRIEGMVSMKRSGIVVGGTGFHPSWHAKIDGNEARPIWVTPGFLAVDVPAGAHRVEFEYRGSALKVVLFCMAIATLVASLARGSGNTQKVIASARGAKATPSSTRR